MKSKQLIIGLAALGIALCGMLQTASAAFPEKLITIIVYVKPVGGIDRDSRKLAVIGERLTGVKSWTKTRPARAVSWR